MPEPQRLLGNTVLHLRLALLVVATFSAVRAVRYGLGREPLPRALTFITDGVSINVYASCWALASVIALASMVKAWPGGSFPTILMCFSFAIGYTISWLTSPESSASHADYVGASNYWTVMLLLTIGYFPFRFLLARIQRPKNR